MILRSGLTVLMSGCALCIGYAVRGTACAWRARRHTPHATHGQALLFFPVSFISSIGAGACVTLAVGYRTRRAHCRNAAGDKARSGLVNLTLTPALLLAFPRLFRADVSFSRSGRARLGLSAVSSSRVLRLFRLCKRQPAGGEPEGSDGSARRSPARSRTRSSS